MCVSLVIILICLQEGRDKQFLLQRITDMSLKVANTAKSDLPSRVRSTIRHSTKWKSLFKAKGFSYGSRDTPIIRLDKVEESTTSESPKIPSSKSESLKILNTESIGSSSVSQTNSNISDSLVEPASSSGVDSSVRTLGICHSIESISRTSGSSRKIQSVESIPGSFESFTKNQNIESIPWSSESPVKVQIIESIAESSIFSGKTKDNESSSRSSRGSRKAPLASGDEISDYDDNESEYQTLNMI